MDYTDVFQKSIHVQTHGYDLQKTLDSGQLFRCQQLPGDEGWLVYSKETYCRARQEGDFVYLDIFGERDERYWPFMLSLQAKEGPLEKLMSGSAFLREAYDFSKGIRILRQDPWEALICFLISQRNNIPKIKSSVESVCWATGRILGQERYGFPRPEAIQPRVLSNCKLGYRENYLYGAAAAVTSGEIILNNLYAKKVSAQRALQELTRLNGVGIKVAQCVALFGLMHGTVFPVDVWIERAMQEGNITADDIASFGELAGLVQQHIYYYMLKRK